MFQMLERRNFNQIERFLLQNQTQWTCQLIRRHQSETQCQAIWHALTQKNWEKTTPSHLEIFNVCDAMC